VVKQSFFGLPGQYGRGVTRANAQPWRSSIRDCIMFVSLTVHGGFSPWSQWSHCAVTCGGALKRRQRSCNNPKPMFGGRNCLGERVQTRSCGAKVCPGETTNQAEI